jgi:hypothetical protein
MRQPSMPVVTSTIKSKLPFEWGVTYQVLRKEYLKVKKGDV